MKPLRLALAALILVVSSIAQNESGVSLTIRFANGTTRFHVGEIIPLELAPAIPRLERPTDLSTEQHQLLQERTGHDGRRKQSG
jgi:hypothetical protein